MSISGSVIVQINEQPDHQLTLQSDETAVQVTEQTITQVRIDSADTIVSVDDRPIHEIVVEPSDAVVVQTNQDPRAEVVVQPSEVTLSTKAFNPYSPPTGFSVSSSYAETSSFATTASYVEGTSTSLPDGVVSSSSQINTGSFTGSFVGDGSGLTDISTTSASYAETASYASNVEPLPNGLVSSSGQIDHDQTQNYDPAEHFSQSGITEVGTVTSGDVAGILPNGTVSSSGQVDYDGLSNVPSGIVSSSSQIDHDQTTNFDSAEHFLQSQITEVGTVTSGDVSNILPSGTVSSSQQINTGSFTGSFVGDGSGLTNIDSASFATTASYATNAGDPLPDGVVSSSSQIDHDQTTNFDSAEHFLQSAITEVGIVTVGDVSAILPSGTVSGSVQVDYTQISNVPEGIVSSSGQVDHDQTANYDSNEHFLQSNITTVGTVTSGDVSQILPSGTVSASSQVDYDGLSNVPAGIVSSSGQVDYDGLSNVPSGIVSSSGQIDHDQTTNFDPNEHFLQSAITEVGTVTVGDVSAILPSDTVSSSVQIDHDQTTNYNSAEHFLQSAITEVGTVTTGDVSQILPSGTVSSSQQINTGSFTGSFVGDGSGLTSLVSASYAQTASFAYTTSGTVEDAVSASYAETASYANKTDLPNGLVSESSQIDHDLTTNFDSNEHYLQSAITEVGTVTTGDVSDILPTGTVSSSGQVDHDQTANFDSAEHFLQSAITEVGTVTVGDVSQILPDGTVSGSSQVDYDGISNVPSGIVSSSGQVDYDGISNVPSGIVSSSGQVDYTGLSNVPSGIVSESSQIDHDQTTNYDPNEHFLQSNITTVGTVTSGDVSDILPSGTVSSSGQVDYDGLSNVPSGIVSSSGQVDYDGLSNVPSGLVSSSGQVDHDQTANFDSAEHFLQSAITEVGTVTTGDVSEILPTGTVSSSGQVDYDGISNVPSGIISSSGQVDHDQTANFDSAEHYLQSAITEVGTVTTGDVSDILPAGTISSSGQVDHDQTANFDSAEHFLQSNITTVGTVTSGDVSEILPTGTVSSSGQIDHDQTTNYDSNEHYLQSAITEVGTVTTGDVSDILPSGTVSASSQVDYDGISNVPSGIVSSSGQVDHDQTANFDSNEHFLQSAITEVGTVTTGDVSQILPAGTVSSSGQVSHDSTDGFVGNEHIDHSTVDVIAGSGLTDGGAITADVTLNIGQGDGITVNANDIAVDSTVLRTTGDAVVSSSGQIDHDQTSNFNANEHFLQSNITTLGTVTVGDVSAILPSGTVSSSQQINTGSFTGSFIGDGSQLTGVSGNGGGIFAQTGSFYSTTNDLQITGSLDVTNGITGSFKGDGSQLQNVAGAESIFIQTGSFYATTKDLQVTGSFDVDGTTTLTHLDLVANKDHFYIYDANGTDPNDRVQIDMENETFRLLWHDNSAGTWPTMMTVDKSGNTLVSGDLDADTITLTNNNNHIQLYDTNAADTNDRYQIDVNNEDLRFIYHDNSAGTFPTRLSISSTGDVKVHENIRFADGGVGNTNMYWEGAGNAHWLILKRGSGHATQANDLIYSWYNGTSYQEFFNFDVSVPELRTPVNFVTTGTQFADTASFAGQLEIPTSSGDPTGTTPSLETAGNAVLTFDDTNQLLYVYSGGTWYSSSFA